MSNFLLIIAFLLASHLIQCVAWGIFLAVGLKWSRAAEVTAGKISFVTVATHLGQWALLLLIGMLVYVGSHLPGLLLMPTVALLALGILLIPIFVVRRTFQLPIWRSIQALLPTLLVLGLGYAITAGVMKPYLWEAFVVSSNSMAPTLRGKHWLGKCPQCGNVTIGRPLDPNEPIAGDEPLMICEHNFHVMNRDHVGQGTNMHALHGPDRMVVAKYKTPQRWDLVAFRFPADPRQVFVMRIVGMPQEKIVIKDGAIWANDKQLTPPEEIKHLVYLNDLPGLGEFAVLPWKSSGSEENPAILGDDEFFVLGDFSANAFDSRRWRGTGDEHSPYAVPRANMIGVAVLIYWPPTRWREF
jgi:signal peptidase I